MDYHGPYIWAVLSCQQFHEVDQRVGILWNSVITPVRVVELLDNLVSWNSFVLEFQSADQIVTINGLQHCLDINRAIFLKLIFFIGPVLLATDLSAEGERNDRKGVRKVE